MDNGKLQSIITRKNEELGRDALRRAEYVIEQIADYQQQISRSQQNIDELRKELVALQVEQLDPTAILGGE